MKRRFLGLAGLFGAGAVGFILGQSGLQFAAIAAPPAGSEPPAVPATPPPEYSQRVVAYIYNSIPITREDLGEYLIARQGVDKIELLVNKKIIEHACQKRGIEVSDAEVVAAIKADMDVIKVNQKDFIDKVLKQYGKTLFEWKEDVIRPRLLLTKLCHDRIKIEDEDLRKAFEAEYGRKVNARIIIWPKGEERIALQEYDAIRKDDQGFDRKARAQAISSLAANGGKTQPIARFSGVHPDVEQQAFSLQPGEVSRLIQTPEGTMVLKVDGYVEANPDVKFELERERLSKAVYDRKIAAEIPVLFKSLKEEAKPVFILKKANDPATVQREVEQEIQQTSGQAPPKP